MKTQLGLLFLTLALVFVSAAQAITVDGIAYLSIHSQSDGIRVLFTARSPSGATDSVFTAADGRFSANLQTGVYDITYSHSGYAEYRQFNQVLFFDSTLDTLALMPPLSGPLTGTLATGRYQVTDTITVPRGQSLTILSGTQLYFDGAWPFIVRGTLNAAGLQGDSILFTRRYAMHDTAWGGIRFDSAGAGCRLDYCVVEYGLGDRGGGISLKQTAATLRNCLVTYNNANSWGGIYSTGAPLSLANCEVSQNKQGGLYCSYDSTVSISSCAFLANGGTGIYLTNVYATLTTCTIGLNRASSSAGGIDCSQSHATIDNCLVYNNYSVSESAGGIAVSSSTASITHSQIIGNSSHYYASGGLLSVYSSLMVSGCVFQTNSGDEGAGILLLSSDATITRCTFVANDGLSDYGSTVECNSSVLNMSCSIIANSISGVGVAFYNYSSSQVSYCNIFGNAGGAFLGDGLPAIGQLITTNANGDSADTYYNIFLDPMFRDAANGDYYLRAGSPCINAGDPSLPHDLDGSIADIGAFPYEPQSVDPGRTAVRSYQLLQNYPNPFNPSTEIVFDLPQAGRVELKVFDVTGRLVNTLVHARLEAGPHEVRFDGASLPSGMYFYQLRAGQLVQTKKMELVK